MGINDPLGNAMQDGGRVIGNRVGHGPRPEVVNATGGDSSSPNIRSLQSALPPVGTLPQPIQDFLESINGLEPWEKAQHIHDFVVGNMAYSNEQASGMEVSPYDVRGVLQNWRVGDCDNHAILTGALLQYAGFDASDLTLVGARSSLDIQNGYDQKFMHAVMVAEINGQKYVFDMNLSDAVPLDGDYTAQGYMADDPAVAFKGHNVLVSYDQFILIAPMGRGDGAYVNMAAMPSENPASPQVSASASASAPAVPAPLPTPS